MYRKKYISNGISKDKPVTTLVRDEDITIYFSYTSRRVSCRVKLKRSLRPRTPIDRSSLLFAVRLECPL